jgi:hypothetical protein
MSDEFFTDTSATSEIQPDFEVAPEFSPQATDDRDDQVAEEPAATTDREADRTQQLLNSSQAGIVGLMSGAHSTGHFTYISYNHPLNEKRQSLNDFIAINNLHRTERTYKSLEQSNIVAYSGLLLQERILLLSCHNEDVALNVAKKLAYQTGIANKESVIIDRNSQGSYNFRNLIDFLVQPAGKRRTAAVSPTSPAAVCVWPAHDLGDDEISAAILASLLSSNAWIEYYKNRMVQGGVCLICVVSPQRIHDYKQTRSVGRPSLRDWELDFLGPLLEDYELSDYESLLETIVQQRSEGKWASSDVEFYKDLSRCLTAGTLPHVVATRSLRDRHDHTDIANLFDRKDVVVATVLYCATYFEDLSHQDFTYVVDLFLGDTTEEVVSSVNQSHSPNGNQIVNIVEQVPALRRWKRETDAVLTRCKIVPMKNGSNRRVMDFSVDDLGSRLREYISSSYPSFYESNFALLRQKGLLFSTRKKIAEGARELFAEIASQYHPNDVANWLYEVVEEFDESIDDDQLSERSPLYRMLPNPNLKVARRHVCYGLSKLLNKLDKDELREAARIFWQRLLRDRHQWLLELLRRMGDFAPPETLKWLKQLFDQGTEEVRRQARAYLLGYLLHRDLAIYATLKELVQWPKSTTGGRIARQVLLAYFSETNRQVAQQDYGRWPALHPLFSFQERHEAEESTELLTGWLCNAAFEVDADNGLLVIADIFAGWCFILSPTSQPQLPGSVDGALNNNSVRELLLTGLARQLSRAQRHELAVVWDRLENDMLNAAVELDSFFGQLNAMTFNVEAQSHVTTARRKLLSTRSLLKQLRKDFTSAAKVVA